MTVLAAVLALALAGWGSAAHDHGAKGDGSDFEPMFTLPRFWIYNGTTSRWAFTGDGIIVSQGAGGGWLMHPKEFGDLELHLEYKMTRGGNSGVTLRCPRQRPKRLTRMKAEPAVIAYEIQLVDDENHPDGKKDTTCTGAIHGIAPALKRNVNKPLGEWNTLVVVARGTKVTVKLNGETVQDVELKEYADKVKGKNPYMLATKGYVGLQSWKGRVEFRNLRIKELPAKSSE
jgi:hypothetical protein